MIRKKKNSRHIKKILEELYIIPQISKGVFGLKTKKDHFNKTAFVSPIFGESVKDEIMIPESNTFGDVIKVYDNLRDPKKRKLQPNYDEFKDVILTNEKRREMYGEDITVKTKEEQKQAKITKVEVPFGMLKDKENENITKNDNEDIKTKSESERIRSNGFNFEIDADLDTTDDNSSSDDAQNKVEESVIAEIPLDDNMGFKQQQPYSYPPISIFEKREIDRYAKHEWIEEHITIINNTLTQFDIEGSVVKYTKGPSVTRYEVRLKPGINVKKITQINDNIKMNLSAKTIRIEAPIPGKPNIGIEVPNVTPEDVLFGNVVDSISFKNKNKTTVVMGYNIDGESVFLDITKMPHGLLAGATGSGKSICINTILISLLIKNSPEELKLLLIDPKFVELIVYDELPHLITPVITDAKMAAGALRWVVDEMEKRYRMLAELRVRDISTYNERIKEYDNMPKMTYLVVVIDELADLMQVSGNDIEDSIQRIAQKSRACGIHLLVATQRPTTDVIKGTIKANIPARIAFKVSSFTDSIVVLDSSGAESLLGRGDMLIKNADNVNRVQGAFISLPEIEAVTDYIRAQRKPKYLFEHDQLNTPSYGNRSNTKDELLDEISRYVVSSGNASINRVSRDFNIGFTRAQSIFKLLEENNIVSTQHGGKPREILVNMEELERFLGGI